MRQARSKRLVPLHVLLRETLSQASTSLFADRVALYLLALSDPAAFRIACTIHRSFGGPDPAETLTRSRSCGLSDPMIWGAAPVETLARAVEGLPRAQIEVWQELAMALRRQHRAGQVPVLRIAEELMIVSSLADYGASEEPAKSSKRTAAAARRATDDLEVEGWAVSLSGDA